MEDSNSVVPLEKQWRRMIERDVKSMLVEGFELELKKRDRVMKDSWFDFIDEMRNFLHELKDFFSRNYVSVQSFSARSRRTSSEPNLDVSFTKNPIGTDDAPGSRPVWTIIKNHESIIRQQTTRGSTLSSYWIERNESINAMERRIQDAIAMSENFMRRNFNLSDLKCRSRAQEKRRIPKSTRRNDAMNQSFEAEIKKLQEERDGLCFQISVIEDTYQLLLRGVMTEISSALCCNGSLSGKVGSDEKETGINGSEIWSWSQILQNYLETTVRDDIHLVVFQETMEQWKMSRVHLWDYLESLLREDIYMLIFQETIQQWKMIPQISRISLESEDDDDQQTDWSENVLARIKEFQFLVDNFEVALHENLESKSSRLEALKSEVDALSKPAARTRSQKLLYEKAFISKSYNLNLAESEVDLLGDQVETLLSLLKKIYIVLHRNATVLSTYFEVNSILNSIKIELNGGGRSSYPKS